GIRDFHVTGVQTCALPIFQYLTKSGVKAGNLQGQIDGRVAFDIPLKSGITASEVTLDARTTISDVRLPNALDNISIDGGELAVRSEERRVGKEGSSVSATA